MLALARVAGLSRSLGQRARRIADRARAVIGSRLLRAIDAWPDHAPRRPEPERPAAAIEIAPRVIEAELVELPRAEEVERWLRALRTDAGCAVADPIHEACVAARRLPDQPAALAALEETVTAPGRPFCVRAAAVAALAALDTEAARRALARMEAVTRRRLAWEGSPEDRFLLRRFPAPLRSLPARAA